MPDTIAGNKPIDASGQLVANDPTASFTDARAVTQVLANNNRVAAAAMDAPLRQRAGADL